MTRRLRPPAPLDVRRGSDGLPARVRRGGRERVVTRVVATWVRPAPWWAEMDEPDGFAVGDPTGGERAYAKVVLDGALVYDIFSVESKEGDAWFVERIYD